MKNFLSVILGSALTSVSFAEAIHDFKGLQQTLTSGHNLHLTLDLSQCTLGYKAQTQDFKLAVIRPNNWRINDKEITSLSLHFTMDNPNFSGKPVYEYLKYGFDASNQFMVHYQVLDKKFEPLTNINDLQCSIGKGVNVYAY